MYSRSWYIPQTDHVVRYAGFVLFALLPLVSKTVPFLRCVSLLFFHVLPPLSFPFDPYLHRNGMGNVSYLYLYFAQDSPVEGCHGDSRRRSMKTRVLSFPVKSRSTKYACPRFCSCRYTPCFLWKGATQEKVRSTLRKEVFTNYLNGNAKYKTQLRKYTKWG